MLTPGRLGHPQREPGEPRQQLDQLGAGDDLRLMILMQVSS
jgi:hypothetical protein